MGKKLLNKHWHKDDLIIDTSTCQIRLPENVIGNDVKGCGTQLVFSSEEDRANHFIGGCDPATEESSSVISVYDSVGMKIVKTMTREEFDKEFPNHFEKED